MVCFILVEFWVIVAFEELAHLIQVVEVTHIKLFVIFPYLSLLMIAGENQFHSFDCWLSLLFIFVTLARTLFVLLIFQRSGSLFY
jgi:hypothetical protein